MSFKLQLFISDNSPISIQAAQNFEALRIELVGHDFDWEIINVTEQPELAESSRVLAVPMLIKLAPEPVVRIVGDLSDRTRIMSLIGVGQPST